MIARVLPAKITNAVSAINKGVFFVTTSLLRAPSINAQMLSVVQNDPQWDGKRLGRSLRLTCDAFHFGLVGPANVWSYPTFPPPFRVSYLIQIAKAIRLKVNKCRALPSPRPKRLCGKDVRTKPQRGLAGVFAF
jgi:hypothetical protein